jgi:hypothetical protein
MESNQLTGKKYLQLQIIEDKIVKKEEAKPLKMIKMIKLG